MLSLSQFTLGVAAPPTRALKNWIPFLKRPAYLDATYAADVGFDPLGLVTMDGPWWDVAGASTLPRRVAWMREAEVKHARLAMLAAAGWPLSELWHGPIAGATGLPFELAETQGRAPAVLNGNIGEAAPILAFIVLFSSYLECKTLDQVHGLTSTGKTISATSKQTVMKTYVPGDLGFGTRHHTIFVHPSNPKDASPPKHRVSPVQTPSPCMTGSAAQA